jgi:hypothetical protein
MIQLKNVLSYLFVAAATFTAQAQANSIDLYLHAEEGGNLHTQTVMLKDSLESAGYQVNLLPLGSCHAMIDYAATSNTPAIYLYSDITHNEQLVANCDVGFNKSTFVVPAYNRLNAFCSPAGTSIEDVTALLNGNEPVSVASSTSAPPHLFDSLGKSLNKPVTMVPYSGTGGSIRGLLGGDADILFAGMTSRVTENEELFCWGTSGSEQIGTMIPMTELFADYEYSTLSSYWFVTGNNIDRDLAATLTTDLNKIFNNDPVWQDYISNGYLVRNTAVTDLTIDSILSNINSWQ